MGNREIAEFIKEHVTNSSGSPSRKVPDVEQMKKEFGKWLTTFNIYLLLS